jgi:hypothetical protein
VTGYWKAVFVVELGPWILFYYYVLWPVEWRESVVWNIEVSTCSSLSEYN